MECNSLFYDLPTPPKGGAARLHWLGGGGLVRVGVPAAALAERRAAAHVGDARLLVAAGGEAGLAGLVRAGGRGKRPGCQGAAGHETPGIVLGCVGQAQAVAGGPGGGAPLTGGRSSLADASPHLLLLLLQLGDLLMKT